MRVTSIFNLRSLTANAPSVAYVTDCTVVTSPKSFCDTGDIAYKSRHLTSSTTVPSKLVSLLVVRLTRTLQYPVKVGLIFIVNARVLLLLLEPKTVPVNVSTVPVGVPVALVCSTCTCTAILNAYCCSPSSLYNPCNATKFMYILSKSSTSKLNQPMKASPVEYIYGLISPVSFAGLS